MRRRWYYWKRMIWASRPLLFMAGAVLMIVVFLVSGGSRIKEMIEKLFYGYGVQAVSEMMKGWFPGIEEENGENYGVPGKTVVMTYLEEMSGEERDFSYSEDPAYERMLAKTWEQDQEMMEEPEIPDESIEIVSIKPTGSVVIREKLADYDYLMKNFYNVHPTTTAGRDMMSAEKFLTMDLSIEKKADEPQILIYHTHSQEAFADYPENEDATIVGVGAYLAELLENQGYQIIHDTTVYDVKDGKLDRSQAYTYALEGITGILQKYPSIEVVLDIHRDGVDENTRLVTEVNGKPTAKIMFFNGTSQTPDGPIEYLPNSNREANMAFSFQMQLLASEQYPDYTRKIYLKGLRYNQHVRARTALVEVGAQTNTYAEALNAMEPLADILCQVLNSD